MKWLSLTLACQLVCGEELSRPQSFINNHAHPTHNCPLTINLNTPLDANVSSTILWEAKFRPCLVIIPVLVRRGTVVQSLCPSAGSAGCHIHRCCYGLAFASLCVRGRRGSPGDGPGLHPPVPLFVVDSPRLDGKSTFLCWPPPYVCDAKIHCRNKTKQNKRETKVE